MHTLSPRDYVHKIINQALHFGASDIYIDSVVRGTVKNMLIAYRIHGVRELSQILDTTPHDEFFRYLRIVMGMRIDAEYVPHDGSCTLRNLGMNNNGDVRCALIPSVRGYSCTLRLSVAHMQNRSLIDLGCDQEHIQDIEHMMRASAGLVIVVGPTGSGKTTLLHSMIAYRAERDVVIAIEDPVEVELKGVRHIEIDEYVGRTYAKCLKSVLRQSPDCILIGELRDAETVAIAIQAALTGHTVYASLHTYGIGTVISRLVDLGASLPSINEVLRGAVAMRLIRTLCTECKGNSETGNCTCRSGYAGRTGIFETSCSIKKFYSSMTEHGNKKVLQGITNQAEIERVLA